MHLLTPSHAPSDAVLAYAWLALLGLRFWKNDSTALFDALLLLALTGYPLYLAPATITSWPASSAVHLLFWSTLGLLPCCLLAQRLRSVIRQAGLKHHTSINGQDAAVPSAPRAMQSLLWPCRTTHTRLFPKRHSFGYSYLLVGVSVEQTGYSGRLVSVDVAQRRAWFHVDAEDHLERDNAHQPKQTLRQKLDDFLIAHNADPAEYRYAYLVTAPRFLGYCFNPVSFWYLYSADRELTAMVLEVNNTFDERRMYLLRIADKDDGTDAAEARDASQDKQTAPVKSFTSAWDKDFHVSPFNSRQGSYRLVAKDPRPFSGAAMGIISNDITLMSSQGRTKLVARVFSTQGPVADTSITVRNAARMALVWGWIGFLTFPRIVKEAGALYFKHALQVFYRPEVVAATSIARTATAQEKVLEGFFARYMEEVVRSSVDPLRVTYRRPVGFGNGRKLIFESEAEETAQATREEVEVRVVTPAFYSRFVHYAHTAEAFDREFLCTDERNQTMVASSTVGLTYLVRCSSSAAQQATAPKGWRWELVRQLRIACEAPSYGDTDKSSSSNNRDQAASGGGATTTASSSTRRDIRAPAWAGIDKFAATQADGDKYRRLVCRRFLEARSGGAWVLASGDVVIRVTLSLIALAAMSQSPGREWGWMLAAAPHAWAGIKRLV